MDPLTFFVPFDETDKEGIVFFGNYLKLAHRALEQFLPTIGIPWADWFQHSTWCVPLRHSEVDYFQPLRAGESYQVQTSVTHMGESSVVFTFQFMREERPVARVKTTHVFATRPVSAMKKIAIPEKIRAHLTPFFNSSR